MAQLLTEGLRLELGLRQAQDRPISRPHNCKPPGTTGTDRTQGKSWQQPGAHQTGFPAPRGAGDGQEVLSLENLLSRSVCSSRPKKIAASHGSKGRRPGKGARQIGNQASAPPESLLMKHWIARVLRLVGNPALPRPDRDSSAAAL